MSNINTYINQIRTALLGRDVRSAIANAIQQCYDDAQTAQVESYVNEWLTDHPEVTTTVQDGAITAAKLNSALSDTIQFRNSINKEYTLTGTKIGTFTHSTSQIQGMCTDGTLLYIAGTSGDNQQAVIYSVNPSTLTVSATHNLVDSSNNPIYGHPNAMDYCDGKIYITGCMATADTADYTKLCVLTLSTWTAKLVSLPTGTKWWAVALLKGYNNKRVLAGHRAETGVLDYFSTIYSGSSAVLGQNKFVPWRQVTVGAFSCDPAGMTQYGNKILIGDAHLSTAFAKNAVRVFTADGDAKGNLYLPVMGDNELEDICCIGNTLYVVDISGNVYSASLSNALSIQYDTGMFANNFNAGAQLAYINENGSETYTSLGNDTYVMTKFRLNPWFFPAKHWITGGTMLVRTGSVDKLTLTATYENSDIVFCGTGKSGAALAYYFFRYTRSTEEDNDEYVYTLTTFGMTAHYNGSENTYSTLADAKAAGYLNGYTYIRELIAEPIARYTTSAMEL